MRKDPFEQQIDDLRERLKALFARASTQPEPILLAEALEELSSTLEELQVAGEELRQQNEELAAARQAIEVERARYQELFDFAPDAYLVSDTHGIIQQGNQAAATLLSTPLASLLGKPLVLFVTEEDRRGFHLGLRRLADRDRFEDWEMNLCSPKGKPFRAALTVNAIRELGGRILGLRWQIRDVTERDQREDMMRESGERLRRILEQSPIAIEIYDVSGQLVYVNEAFLELFGVSNAGEVKGFNLFDNPNLSDEVKRRLNEGEILRFEAPFDFEKVEEGKSYPTTRSGVMHLDFLISSLSLGQKEIRSGYLVYIQDITERKRAEQELASSRDAATRERIRLETILDTVPSGVIVAEGPGVSVTLQNRKAIELHGRTLELGLSGEQRIKELHLLKKDGSPYQVEELPVARALQKGEIVRDEEMLVEQPDGKQITVSVNAAPLRDRAGDIVAAVGAFNDITRRKKLEQALRRSRDRLEKQIQKRTHELNMRVKELNCLCAISRLASGPDISLKYAFPCWVEIIPKGWQYPDIACARIRVNEKEYKTENFQETPWNQTCEILLHGKPVGTIEVHYLEERPAADEGPFLQEERVLIETIAEQLGERIAHRRAEKEVLNSESKHRALVEQIPAIIYAAALDESASMTYISPQVESILGFSPDTFTGVPARWLEQIHPEDRDRMIGERAQARAHGAPILSEYRMRTRDGREVWLHDEAAVVRDSGGHPLFLQGVVSDITGRKSAEEALQESRKSLAKAQSIGHIGSWDWDFKTGKVTWSDEMYRIFGIDPDEFDGFVETAVSRAIHPDDREKVRKANEQVYPSTNLLLWNTGSSCRMARSVSCGPRGRWFLILPEKKPSAWSEQFRISPSESG